MTIGATARAQEWPAGVFRIKEVGTFLDINEILTQRR